jgi:hypothetical protein
MRQIPLFQLAIALALAPAPAGLARAAIQLEAHAIGGAGGVSATPNGSLQLGATAGLPCVGQAGAGGYEQILGFWRWGTSVPSDAGEAPSLPLCTQLHPNRPNPFRGATEFVFDLAGSEASGTPAAAAGPAARASASAGPSLVRLDIYDVTGRLVRRLVHEPLAPGAHRALWDGRNAQGARVSAGVYFARFTAGTTTQTRRVVVGSGHGSGY